MQSTRASGINRVSTCQTTLTLWTKLLSWQVPTRNALIVCGIWCPNWTGQQGGIPITKDFYICYSPNTCFMWTYPKSALTPISCVQAVAYSIKNHKPWECKNLMQVCFKWLIEPHEIGVWHLKRAKTILYSWDGKSKKWTLRQLLSHLYPVYIIISHRWSNMCTGLSKLRLDICIYIYVYSMSL